MPSLRLFVAALAAGLCASAHALPQGAEPEPASYITLIAAFGAVAWVARRRR